MTRIKLLKELADAADRYDDAKYERLAKVRGVVVTTKHRELNEEERKLDLAFIEAEQIFEEKLSEYREALKRDHD